MAADLGNVFFNLDEFACVHEIIGRQISCIVDEEHGGAASGAADGFADQSSIGLLQCDRVVLCQAADLVPQPLPGEKITMDGSYWLVADSGVVETEGLLKLPLVRAY
ncbi:MAG: hypothetical protein HDQ91_05025 [Desulfovibrio sp.]|nr:hypothetical protein [Desulfovibrio sp.]